MKVIKFLKANKKVILKWSFVFNYERAKDGEEYDSRLMITKNRLNGKLLTGDNAIKLHYSEKSKRILANTYEQKQYSCFRKSAEDIDNDLGYDLDF